jgi:hypothetical protein
VIKQPPTSTSGPPSSGFVTLDRLTLWFKQPRVQLALRVIGALCFVAINGYIAYSIYRDWDVVRSFPWTSVNIPGLLVTLTIQSLGMCLAVFSWSLMMQRLGYDISYREHFRAYALSFLSQKLPGFGWSIISKVYLYGEQGAHRGQIAVLSGAEHVISGIGAALAGVILLAAGGANVGVNPWVLAAALAGFCIVLSLPAVQRRILTFSALQHAGSALRARDLFLWVVLSALVTLTGGLVMYLFCAALGAVEAQHTVMIVQAWVLFVFASALLFWLPIDIGISTAIVLIVLGQVMSGGESAVILIAWRVWNNVILVIWSLAGLMITSRKSSINWKLFR